MRPLLVCVAVALAALAPGCSTPAPTAFPLPVPMIGRPIEDVLNRYPEGRAEYFDAAGRKLDKLPMGYAGSVSIYLPDKSGQENFAFDQGGIVVRQMYSYGNDYHLGAWKQVVPGRRLDR